MLIVVSLSPSPLLTRRRATPKVIAFGNGDARPVMDAPLRRVSDPEGNPCLFNHCSRCRPRPARLRSIRRAFTPSRCAGPYRLPHDVRDRLATALVPFRNRDAAFALAVFLGRFWSTPARLPTAFPIDRRELADHAGLGLTEARVRGAIRTLEDVGFLDRAPASGSTHRPTPDGLHRKPVLFMFGAEYGPLFSKANRLAAAARERRSGWRRGSGPPARDRRSRGLSSSGTENLHKGGGLGLATNPGLMEHR